MTNKSTTSKAGFDAAFLKQIKQTLEDLKVKFSNELANMSALRNNGSTDDSGIFPDYGDAEEDKANEVADYETNLSIEADLERSLRDVNVALERLEKGEYGICKYCKKPIAEKRLLARPTSSACVECKKTIVQEA